MNAVIKYPPEPVEFVRMLVRAFHPIDFIIVTDALLRLNNWSNSGNLSRRLRIQPKELRQILTRMAHARLVRSEKRVQRVQANDDRRSIRNVNTDFWYMPIPEIIDVFVFRVHRISTEVEKKRSSMIAKQKYVCAACKKQYELIDIVKMTDANGRFICDRMGVRLDRRHGPCGGLISEFDTSDEVKKTERLSHMLTVELRPLRERADVCARMDIPNHPLGNVSEEVWGELVPTLVDANGKRIDPDNPDGDEAGSASDAAAKAAAAAAAAAAAEDDAAIPERPTWFKDTADEDGDADWDDQQQEERVLNTDTGTAATLKEDDGYYERYMRGIAGLPEEAEQEAEGEKGKTDMQMSGMTSTRTDSSTAAPALSSALPTAGQPPAQQATDAAVQPEQEDVFVSVAGKQVRVSEVTLEMQEQMTEKEFKAFVDLAARTNGADGGSDDDFDDF